MNGQSEMKFGDMAKRSTRFDNKRIHHMVYLNHLSANRNIKKKGIKDSGIDYSMIKIDEINFTRTLKSFEEVKQIISNELRNLIVDFGKFSLIYFYFVLSYS